MPTIERQRCLRAAALRRSPAAGRPWYWSRRAPIGKSSVHTFHLYRKSSISSGAATKAALACYRTTASLKELQPMNTDFDSSAATAALMDRFNEVFLRHDPAALPGLIAEHCVIEKIGPAPDG